jgi:protoheme IX farnesyltransferase
VTLAGAGRAGPNAESRSFGGFFASLLRIARPGIAAGVTLSGLAGMVLAAKGLPAPHAAVAGLSCILAAACGSAIVNGLLDAGMDARMPRVAVRVAALEQVGRRGALLLSLAMILCSVAAAGAFVNATFTILLLGAIASYTLLYTLFLKRRSPYGTIPGGIPGALPVLVGYAAVDTRLGADGILLFLLMLMWQPPHFWSLALRYREEYRSAGVPALPVALGEPYTKVLIFLYLGALLPLSLGLWWLRYCSAHYALAALILWLFFLGSCLQNIVIAPRFGRAFGASILYIMGLLLAVVADLSLRRPA